jgi:hypothetical protein
MICIQFTSIFLLLLTFNQLVDADWNNVKIHNLISSTALNIAEIKVYYGTTQITAISYSQSSEFEYAYLPASNCFDDDLNTFSHTSGDDTNPYLIFNLDSNFDKIEVYNRVDCCQDRIYGATLTVTNEIDVILHENTFNTSGAVITTGASPNFNTFTFLVNFNPTSTPSRIPTVNPSRIPTTLPTSNPTSIPSCSPSIIPTYAPTSMPTVRPSTIPTYIPSSVPSSDPTFVPTAKPTSSPSGSPSSAPSSNPTSLPTTFPSDNPTSIPLSDPTTFPSLVPTSNPTNSPSNIPTSDPTVTPTTSPTEVDYRGTSTALSFASSSVVVLCSFIEGMI